MPNWFSIRAAKDKKRHDILIYDQIGKDWFSNDGVSAKEFAEGLKAIPTEDEILVSINSPGGNVWDGLAIYNQLKQRREKVTTRVDGVAASIASVIALAGHRLEMPENAMFMIHDASGLAMGNAAVMRDMADMLDQHSDMLAGIYAEKTGKSREKMRAMMREETWMDGIQAMSHGFADSLTEQIKMAASASFDFSAFRRVPVALGKPTNPPLPAAGNNADTMQKDKIVALLTQHGKQIAADATDEQLLAALTELVVIGKVKAEDASKLKDPPKPNRLVPQDEWDAMVAQTKHEREMRIRNELNVIAIDRPFINVTEWLPKAIADETVLANLRAMPIVPTGPGANPVAFGTIQNNGNSMVEKYRAMKPGHDRKTFAVENWNGLQHAFEQANIQAASALPIQEQLRRLQSPRAVNTYSATLVTDRLADALITTIGTKLAALRGFTRDFGVDQLKPKATVQVRRITATSAAQTDPTSFETGDTTSTAASVTVAQINKCFHATNDELNKGHQVQQGAEKNAQTFSNAISDIVTGVMTVANFGAATTIGAAANFDATDLAPIYALAKNYGTKNLILDGGHLAYLLPTDKFKFRLGEEGAYNFDLIAEHNRWTGAATNAVGFICDPNAIAVAAGLPVSLPASEFIELNTVNIPSLDLSVLLTHWFSRSGRVHWMAYDVMFGAIAGDTTAGEVLVSA